MESRDARIVRDGNRWVLSTAKVEKVVALEDGVFLQKSLVDRVTGSQLGAGSSDEFFLWTGDGSEYVSGSSGGWKLGGCKETELHHGELQLEIALQRGDLQVLKTYVLHPESSLIREWVTIRNLGHSPMKVIEPGFLIVRTKVDDLGALDFNWMTGGECQPGSWNLKTDSLAPGETREFDSYDPFPDVDFPGNGTIAKIILGGKQLWWGHVAHDEYVVTLDQTIDVKAGCELIFSVGINWDPEFALTAGEIAVTYADGETHNSREEFSGEQGSNGWRYQYGEKLKYSDMAYSAEHGQWRVPGDDSGHAFIGETELQPFTGQDVVRVWTAPRAGQVHVTGTLCNIGNKRGLKRGKSHRCGSSSYAPWYALQGRETGNGLFIGWDYFGHWISDFQAGKDGAVTARLRVAGHKQTLAPGESVTTPKAFIGLYRDDLDNAGNECLDWQYRYMWDYTREGWFGAIRMLGYWWKGTGWMVQQYSGYQDIESTTNKVFRTADLMRYCGADVYHRDWGWWDKAGDWNGPDWNVTREYLAKSGIGQLIYAFVYGGVDPDSKVALEHPEWLVGNLLDMSKPEVVVFLKNQLDSFRQRWGRFEWRTDGGFTAPVDGDDTPLLGQDQGFREIIRSFLDHNPDCAFQACNGGGNYLSYEYVALNSTIQMTDGAVGLRSDYYTSLLVPPDRMCHMPDCWDPNAYDKATWRGLLSLCFDMTGDTWDPEKLEGVRELIDIYHYLYAQGVAGRWVKVYRPVVEGDDATMYFQRMSGDGKRGIIITKHLAENPVTIKPKGLIPDAQYHVSFQETEGEEVMVGADLMDRGIHFDRLPAGELVYLNLPMHPGSKLDATPPTAPLAVSKRAGQNMGQPGVELFWKPGTDDNWISYYEIQRNGRVIDKVAKGTYYFDHSAGADLAADYAVRAVDGAGNVSEFASAISRKGTPSKILDDTDLTYTGEWEHTTGHLPAYNGTLSSSSSKGAAAETPVVGSRVYLFGKLGPDCGKAAITIGDGEPEIVDTYSADDIWGYCIYRREFEGPCAGTLRVEVLGEHSDRSSGDVVHIDGVRVE